MSVTADYRTVSEVARELRVSRKSIYRAVQRGELLAFRIGPNGQLRIPAERVSEYMRPVTQPEENAT